MSKNKRWKWFEWEFDEEQYIPSIAALKSFDLDIYELQLRKYANGLDRDSARLNENLQGIGVAPEVYFDRSLGVAGGEPSEANDVSVTFHSDDDFLIRREAAQARNGDPANFDRDINASLWNSEGKWYVEAYLSPQVFNGIKDGVLRKNLKTISIALRSNQTLTDSRNQYGDVDYVNWYLPIGLDGKPIWAGCKLTLYMTVGDIWPLRKPERHEEDEENELDNNEHETSLTPADRLMLQQLAITQSIQNSIEVTKRYALISLVAVLVMVFAVLSGLV